MLNEPKEPGWYIARMKTWATGDSYAVVRVTQYDSCTLQVWQCADERAWPIEAWNWRERIYI